jgi:hypothetical protein
MLPSPALGAWSPAPRLRSLQELPPGGRPRDPIMPGGQGFVHAYRLSRRKEAFPERAAVGGSTGGGVSRAA